jgi:hypothetical protein
MFLDLQKKKPRMGRGYFTLQDSQSSACETETIWEIPLEFILAGSPSLINSDLQRETLWLNAFQTRKNGTILGLGS